MVLDKIGNVFKNALAKIASAVFVDKKLIDSVIKDLQRAMLEADVNVEFVFEFSEKIRKTAPDQKEQLIKMVHDELVSILGGEKKEIEINTKTGTKIMLLGLYGCGKTTTVSKLANYYMKRGIKVAAIGLDVYRPAAIEQLEQLGQKAKFPVFSDKEEKNPIKIWKTFENQLSKYDLVIVDTAGRDALDKELINEIHQLKKSISPDYTILVMPADIGQTAKKQAEEFQKAASINGVIITRMDGTAKGGGVLIACNQTKAPVYFIGTGEKLQDIETFNPTALVSRMLGMGDLEGLIEKAKLAIEEGEQDQIEKRLSEGKFTLLDLYGQLKAMQEMGPLGKIAEMIPGMGKIKIPEEMLSNQQDKLKRWKYAINSMTKEEIDDPDLIQGTRIARISKGSNVSASDIRELLKQYKLIKQLVGSAKGEDLDPSKMSQKHLRQLAKKFKGKIKF